MGELYRSDSASLTFRTQTLQWNNLGKKIRREVDPQDPEISEGRAGASRKAKRQTSMQKQEVQTALCPWVLAPGMRGEAHVYGDTVRAVTPEVSLENTPVGWSSGFCELQKLVSGSSASVPW